MYSITVIMLNVTNNAPSIRLRLLALISRKLAGPPRTAPPGPADTAAWELKRQNSSEEEGKQREIRVD